MSEIAGQSKLRPCKQIHALMSILSTKPSAVCQCLSSLLQRHLHWRPPVLTSRRPPSSLASRSLLLLPVQVLCGACVVRRRFCCSHGSSCEQTSEGWCALLPRYILRALTSADEGLASYRKRGKRSHGVLVHGGLAHVGMAFVVGWLKSEVQEDF